MAFVLHVPIVTPCLRERVVSYFNEVYGLQKHEEAAFFYWRDFKRLRIKITTKVSKQQN